MDLKEEIMKVIYAYEEESKRNLETQWIDDDVFSIYDYDTEEEVSLFVTYKKVSK